MGQSDTIRFREKKIGASDLLGEDLKSHLPPKSNHDRRVFYVPVETIWMISNRIIDVQHS